MKYSDADIAYLKGKNAPELAEAEEPESILAWQAFFMLRGARQAGMAGIGPIPFSAIKDFSDWAGITCPVQKQRLTV